MKLANWIRSAVASLMLCAGALSGGACDAQCMDGYVCPLPPVAQPKVIGPQAAAPGYACRVVVRSSNGVSYGSGVLVKVTARKGYVLTCHHVMARSGDARVVFLNLAPASAKVIKTDPAHDLALLEISRPDSQPSRISAQAPFGLLTVGGFGHDGRWRVVTGPIVRYATPLGAKTASVVLRGAVRRGDSGGPVTNSRGELVGIVWGVRGGESYATVRAPLRRIIGSLEESQSPKFQPPALVPVKPPPSDAVHEKRFATIEQRLESLKPCSCDGQCVRRGELTTIAGDSRQRHEALLDRIESVRGEARQSAIAVVVKRLEKMPADRASLTTLQVVLAALGIGGPAGLGILAASVLAKHRLKKRLHKNQTHRRGSGGPRQETFPERATDSPKRNRERPPPNSLRLGRGATAADRRRHATPTAARRHRDALRALRDGRLRPRPPMGERASGEEIPRQHRGAHHARLVDQAAIEREVKGEPGTSVPG